VENRVITILGCTASGKGQLARALAATLDGEILSVDSMKVYRGLDIGTAKPAPADHAAISHHLIDVVDPWEPFSAARFVELADAAVADCHARGRPIIAVGGTVLYFKAFYQGLFAGPTANPRIRAMLRERAATHGTEALHAELARVDPHAAARIHPNDLRRIERALEVFELTARPISALQQQWRVEHIRRPDWNWRLIGLRLERDAANRRINDRVRRMIASGLVDEARRLWSDPRGLSSPARQAVGYAELFEHFDGRAALDDAIEHIKIHTRRLAKQQRTWLKRLPRVEWLQVGPDDSPPAVLTAACRLLAQNPS